jgi:hypothetical protein
MQMGAVEIWQALAAPERAALVESACTVDSGDVLAVQQVRKLAGDAELARAALLLGQARRKLREKFGDRAATMWADPQGAEMASSVLSAEHKARRIGRTGVKRVVDVCCGIGGDAMLLAERGMRVRAVDLEPVRAWMAWMNAGPGCEAIVADAADVDVAGALVHIDPARRHVEGGGVRRAWTLNDLAPGPSVVRALLERSGVGGAVKLGPGVDHAEVRRELPPGELEFFSENGRLTQAVLWVGKSVCSEPGTTRATLIRRKPDEAWNAEQTVELVGVPDEHVPPIVADARARAYLYEPDDSIERARLQHVLCEGLGAELLHPALGVVTSDAIVHSDWVRSYRVIEQMAWNAKRVRQALTALDAGLVEVKTRGGAVDTDVLQKELRGKGARALVVFVYRVERQMIAIVAERL